MTIKQIEGYTIYMSQVLGRGSYGNVYKGFNESSKQSVAIKIIPRDKGDQCII
jgi:serine/threonine protein kinase